MKLLETQNPVEGFDIIKCKLRGIKEKVLVEQVETEDELKQGIRWVTTEGAEYNLEAKEILEWLSRYGTFKTNLTDKLFYKKFLVNSKS